MRTHANCNDRISAVSRRGEYTFGDTQLAAERLAVVAGVFDAPTRALLGEVRAALAEEGAERPALAVDLGCGPGHTTRLIAGVTGAAHTVGLDASVPFLGIARAAGGDGIDYVEHDITSTPFPLGPADLMYCRLVLAHLPEPASLIARWMTQVAPGGILALDEVEFIDTPNAVLSLYEEMVVALVASRGALMYAGPDIADLAGAWPNATSRLVEHLVPAETAARMYAMNLPTWRHDPAITAAYTQETVDRLAKDLGALAGSMGDPPVRWGLRQALFRRTGQTTQSVKGERR
jgi:SAM-dependent methyltransferase